MNDLVPIEAIAGKIFVVRGMKVMLDRDLAELYNVETGQLKRAVRRNIERFPSDFMFELSKNEYDSLRCQIGTLKRGGHSKYLPMAFTEHGVAMLSSVLKSKRAIQVNIQIVRAFAKLRELLSTHKDLERKIEKIEENCDQRFQIIFETLDQLLAVENTPKKKIGFTVKETQWIYDRRSA